MLRKERVTQDSKILEQVMRLYAASFPRNERIPLGELLDANNKAGEVLAFYDDNLFVGFACMLHSDIPVSHIIFLAVDPQLRSHGYGSSMLQALHAHKPDRKIFVDIEAENEAAPNNAQRHQRKQFYVRNGYRETTVSYQWKSEQWAIMVHGGDLSESEYQSFWDNLKLDPNRY